jgi:hypothetical protein
VRRILLLVTVAVVMAALVMVAGPALAAPGGQGDENRAMPRETRETPHIAPGIEESAPTSVPNGYFERPESVESKGRRPATGPTSLPAASLILFVSRGYWAGHSLGPLFPLFLSHQFPRMENTGSSVNSARSRSYAGGTVR